MTKSVPNTMYTFTPGPVRSGPDASVPHAEDARPAGAPLQLRGLPVYVPGLLARTTTQALRGDA